jgi:hypothetical protein
MRAPRFSVLLIILALCPVSAFAWSEHNILGYFAIARMPEIENAPAVPAESLESFLAKESEGLAKLLEEEEKWARKNLPGYPVRPQAFAMSADAAGRTLKTRFLQDLRINPDSRTPLYTQLLPGEERGTRPVFPVKDVSVFKNPLWLAPIRFAALSEGEPVKPLDIIAAGCDEPDFGLDIGLWEDSKTDFGARAGFGKQPFGNPNLDYGTQAPFHMGFYQEAKIVYLLAGFLKRTYPELRVRQAFALSRYAFKTGHPYWGYRFMGWGLHYVQDLTQPYHGRVLPGVGTLRMLWINFLDIIGRSQSKTEMIQLVSNRHLALENFQKLSMYRDLRKKDQNQPYWHSLMNASGDEKYGKFNRLYLRNKVTKESEERADELSRQIMALMPVRLVDDPGVEFEEEKSSMDLLRAMEQNVPGSVSRFSNVIADLMGSAGAHSRNYVRAVLAGKDEYDEKD